MPKKKPTMKEIRTTAKAWKSFRRQFSFSQIQLAKTLGVSRRTVQNAEAGDWLPLISTRMRFRALKIKQERADAGTNPK